MSENKTQNNGIGVLGLLGVLFVGLKLTGHITWSWWWVTLPFWGGVALILAMLLGFGVVLGVAAILDAMGKRRRSVNKLAR